MNRYAAGVLFFFTVLAFSVAGTAYAAEKNYFKAPDYWELTLGDQEDYIDLRVDNYCAAKKIDRSSLDYVCGTVHSLERVFKNKYWFKGEITDTVSLGMARNEREAVQIAVIPLKEKDLQGMTLSVGPLQHKSGYKLPAGAVNVYNVEYVETVKASYPTAHIGWWPDPLVPAVAVDIPAAEARAIWIEVRTPADAPAGRYQGTVTVSGRNTQAQALTLQVEVWDFTLPRQQIVQTCTWLNPKGCAVKYGREREREMYLRYTRYFLDHKINPLDVGSSYFKKDDYSLVTESLAQAVAAGLTRFQIPRLKGDDLRKYCGYLRQQGWFDKAMIYGYKDEPHPRDYEAFRKDSAEIRNVEPKLKIFMAESPHPGLYGAVDIWWSSMPADNRKYIDERLAAGDQVWWYRCGIPIRLEYYRPFYEYPSDVLLDRPSIDMRIFYLMMWKFRMTPATFFYSGMSWPAGSEKWPQQPWQTGSWPWNGDGYVVYPGEDGPLPSVRLKCISDGIEDYEYLHLLRQAVANAKGARQEDIAKAKKLLSVPEELVVFTYHYNKDPQALQKFRRQVAEMIVKLESFPSPRPG